MKKLLIIMSGIFLIVACTKVDTSKTSDVDSTKVDSVSVVDSTK